LNKLVEEKAEEWKEEQQDNTDSVKNQNQEQQPHLSLSAQACIFFKVVFFTHLFVSFFLSSYVIPDLIDYNRLIQLISKEIVNEKRKLEKLLLLFFFLFLYAVIIACGYSSDSLYLSNY
jgi:type II secretory pathway component PulF